MMRTSTRGTRAVIAVLAAALTVGAVIAPVAAASPQQVNIVAIMTFPGTGTFTATGSAVDGGLICEHGTVLDTSSVYGGWQSARKVQVLSRKEFTCTDGSGSFFVTIQIHVVFGGEEPFGWVAQGGTGAYGDLRGSGSGVTVEPIPGGNTNIYDGFLVH